MSEDQYNILFGTHKLHIYSGGSCNSVSFTQDRESCTVAYLCWLEHACRLFEIGWFHTLRFLDLTSRAHDFLLQFRCQNFFAVILLKRTLKQRLCAIKIIGRKSVSPFLPGLVLDWKVAGHGLLVFCSETIQIEKLHIDHS